MNATGKNEVSPWEGIERTPGGRQKRFFSHNAERYPLSERSNVLVWKGRSWHTNTV